MWSGPRLTRFFGCFVSIYPGVENIMARPGSIRWLVLLAQVFTVLLVLDLVLASSTTKKPPSTTTPSSSFWGLRWLKGGSDRRTLRPPRLSDEETCEAVVLTENKMEEADDQEQEEEEDEPSTAPEEARHLPKATFKAKRKVSKQIQGEGNHQRLQVLL